MPLVALPNFILGNVEEVEVNSILGGEHRGTTKMEGAQDVGMR